jgi:hypothetical protein
MSSYDKKTLKPFGGARKQKVTLSKERIYG